MYLEDAKDIGTVLERAQEALPGYHNIVELQNMTFVCVAEEIATLLGTTAKAMLGLPASDFMAMERNSTEFEQVLLNVMQMATVNCPVKNVNGLSADMKIICSIVEVGGDSYLVAKFDLGKTLDWK